MRLRRLIALDLLLLAASVPGIFNVLAKDHVSTFEGVIAWVSAAVFILSLLALLGLIVVSIRRDFANPFLRRGGSEVAEAVGRGVQLRLQEIDLAGDDAIERWPEGRNGLEQLAPVCEDEASLAALRIPAAALPVVQKRRFDDHQTVCQLHRPVPADTPPAARRI